LQGGAGGAMAMARGCSFADRCPRAEQRCREERPALQPVAGTGHVAACHFAGEVQAAGAAGRDQSAALG
ncbi:MAG: hypothetical protein RLO22_04060, partial [Sneathiellaceae bacterium]